MKKLIQLAIFAGIVCTLLSPLAAKAQFDRETFDPWLERDTKYNVAPLYEEMRRLVNREYPQATSNYLRSRIHFEYNTRVFLIHGSSMFGDWSDAREVRGPNLGGVECNITVVDGQRKMGQRIYIQSEGYMMDEGLYFNTYYLTPYSKKLDAYLNVALRFPRNPPQKSPQKFRREFAELVNRFDEFVEKPIVASVSGNQDETATKIIQKSDLPGGGKLVQHPIEKQTVYYFTPPKIHLVGSTNIKQETALYRSIDSGQTWSLPLDYFDFRDFFIHPQSGELFALICEKALSTNNEGFFVPKNLGYKVIRSADGQKWKDVTGKQQRFTGPRIPHEIQVDPLHPDRVRLYGRGFRGYNFLAVDDNYSDWNVVDIPSGPTF